MRILRRCSPLLALLLLAACDGGGTLPAAGGPVVGEWTAPTDAPLTNQVVDRAEWRLDYREDGTYTSQILWYDDDRDGDPVVYRSEAAGEYRVEAGALSQNVRTWRHWNAARGTWQSEYVAVPDAFAPPVPYAVEGDRLTLYYGHRFNEDGVDAGPWEAVFTRR